MLHNTLYAAVLSCVLIDTKLTKSCLFKHDKLTTILNTVRVQVSFRPSRIVPTHIAVIFSKQYHENAAKLVYIMLTTLY